MPASETSKPSRPLSSVCLPAFVDTTNAARGTPARARPSRRSERVEPYAGAVSNRVTPASSAACTVAIASSSATGPYTPPSAEHPRPVRETRRPVRPRGTRSVGRLTPSPDLDERLHEPGRAGRPGGEGPGDVLEPRPVRHPGLHVEGPGA